MVSRAVCFSRCSSRSGALCFSRCSRFSRGGACCSFLDVLVVLERFAFLVVLVVLGGCFSR